MNIPRSVSWNYADIYPLTNRLEKSTLGKPGDYQVLEDMEGRRYLAPEIHRTDKDQLVWAIPMEPMILHGSGSASKLNPYGSISPLKFIASA